MNRKLLVKMQRATDAVIDKQAELNDSLDELQAKRDELKLGGPPLEPVNLRTAAFALAIKCVAEVTAARGIWP